METLIILKSMPRDRNKDAVDLLALLRDKRNVINLTTLTQKAKSADLTPHLLDRIRDYAGSLRDGELDKV